MQALSQLSYGPTLMLRAAYHSGGFAGWEAFYSFLPQIPRLAMHAAPARADNKNPRHCRGSLFEAGVPTGIRTPVATVKG